jgi:hypothetical protein
MEFLIMQFSRTSYYVVPLGSKYSPQHSVLKHPLSKLFPNVRDRVHTDTKLNYTSIYFNLCFSGHET